ncbi:unnamed protein product [Caenorhabditis nigoni]
MYSVLFVRNNMSDPRAEQLQVAKLEKPMIKGGHNAPAHRLHNPAHRLHDPAYRQHHGIAPAPNRFLP